jgi:hypothetical protein
VFLSLPDEDGRLAVVTRNAFTTIKNDHPSDSHSSSATLPNGSMYTTGFPRRG